MSFTYEYAPHQSITTPHGPRGAILRSAPQKVLALFAPPIRFVDMPACSQILPIQEDVPAELHTYRRMKMLTGDLPAPFVAYVAQNDWVNNCFMSAETEYGIHWVVRFCI